MNTDQTRVFFRVERPGLPQPGVEGLWAERVGPDTYRLLNIPFLARGYAWGDVVRCDNVQDRLVAQETISHSGSSTLRLLFRDTTRPEVQQIVGYLQYLGCSFENSHNLYAFDVPPEPQLKVSFKELVGYLKEMASDSDNFDWETGKVVG